MNLAEEVERFGFYKCQYSINGMMVTRDRLAVNSVHINEREVRTKGNTYETYKVGKPLKQNWTYLYVDTVPLEDVIYNT